MKDHTGQQIVTAFGEQAEEIMGMPAETLREIEGTKEFDHAVVVSSDVSRNLGLDLFSQPEHFGRIFSSQIIQGLVKASGFLE